MTEVRTGSLWDEAGLDPDRECFDPLAVGEGWRLERIVSHGCASPDGDWYDPSEDEWVLLARGQATLEFDDGSLLDLEAGHWVVLPAHTRHRVARVSDDAVWVALHGKQVLPHRARAQYLCEKRNHAGIF